MRKTSTTTLRAWFLALCGILAFEVLLPAQDTHFSQFYNTPLYVNPALTAVDKADIRFMGAYRGQWEQALFDPYTTFFGMFDTKFYPKYNDRYFWGLGVSFLYDVAGQSSLGLLGADVNASFTYALDKENFVTIGFGGGGAQRSFQLDNLSFGEQHNGEQYDPNLPTGENFTSLANFFGSLGGGLNYHGQKTGKRTYLDVGAAAFHINRPNQAFYSADESALPMRLSLYMRPMLQLSEQVDLPLHGLAQFQGPYFEAVAGAGIRVYLNLVPSREIAVELGGSYRFNSIGDAIIPHLQILYHQWQVGLSYDINVSDFSVATLYRGGPELTVRYAITKVKPLDRVRLCRLY